MNLLQLLFLTTSSALLQVKIYFKMYINPKTLFKRKYIRKMNEQEDLPKEKVIVKKGVFNLSKLRRQFNRKCAIKF